MSEKIRKQLEAIGDVRWRHDKEGNGYLVFRDDKPLDVADCRSEEIAEFVASAPNNIRELLAENDRLKIALERIRGLILRALKEDVLVEAFVGLDDDRYDLVAKIAFENGRDMPNEDDEIDGFLRLLEHLKTPDESDGGPQSERD